MPPALSGEEGMNVMLKGSWRGRRSALLSLLALGVMGAAAPRAQADEAAEAARAIGRELGNAVLTVRVVIKTRVVVEGRQMNESENANETVATVVSPEGLAVCALSEVDPSHQLEMMREAGSEYQFEAEVADLKLVRPDGKELAAEVVVQDKDLDLAVLRPSEKPAEPMTAVDLTQERAPEMLEQLVVLSRLGEVANRASSVALDRVQAIVQKPRTLYVTGVNGWVSGLGCPVFALDGKLVGIVVMRSMPAIAGGSGGGRSTNMPAVLPAADVRAVVEQAAQ